MKIAINGKTGRMGKMLVDCIAERDDGTSVVSMMDQPDVFIDFARPLSTLSILSFAVEHRIPMVIGTTGFTGLQQLQITRAAEKIPVVQSPNMSMGINLCVITLEQMTQRLMKMDPNMDVAISDAHHNQKVDAPSGTALRLGQAIEAGGFKKEIQYTSLRLSDMPGEHSVIFALKGEQIVLTHHADSRLNFALGAIRAAEWVVKREAPGLYDMQPVLGLDAA